MPKRLTCDVPGEGRRPSIVRVWRKRDRLNPTPPDGWFIAATLSLTPALDLVALGIWLYLLATVQQWERDERGMRGRLHCLARAPDGTRVLLVAPAIARDVAQDADMFQGQREGGCNCGGGCIESELQSAARRVFIRRAWNRLTWAQRLRFVTDHKLSPTVAADDQLDIDVFETFTDGDVAWELEHFALEPD